MELTLGCKVIFFTCMKTYVLIRRLNCIEIAIFFYSYVCVEECLLFRVRNGFPHLYFKSKGLSNVSILINF